MVINEDAPEPILIREEEDDEDVHIATIPEADGLLDSSRRSARRKRPLENAEDDALSDRSDSGSSALFVPSPPSKRSKTREKMTEPCQEKDAEEAGDDKKKLGLNTSYDGFSIYGRILCLVVKRRGARIPGPASSQQMLENWVSTQAAAEPEDDEDVG